MFAAPVLVLHAKLLSSLYPAPVGQSDQPRFRPDAEAVQTKSERRDAVIRVFFIVPSRENEQERRTKPSSCAEDTKLPSHHRLPQRDARRPRAPSKCMIPDADGSAKRKPEGKAPEHRRDRPDGVIGSMARVHERKKQRRPPGGRSPLCVALQSD